jgi:hypothetical protein
MRAARAKPNGEIHHTECHRESLPPEEPAYRSRSHQRGYGSYSTRDSQSNAEVSTRPQAAGPNRIRTSRRTSSAMPQMKETPLGQTHHSVASALKCRAVAGWAGGWEPKGAMNASANNNSQNKGDEGFKERALNTTRVELGVHKAPASQGPMRATCPAIGDPSSELENQNSADCKRISRLRLSPTRTRSRVPFECPPPPLRSPPPPAT